MMTPAPLVPMLSLLFTITGLWVLFFELYKPYRVDAFRQSVFAIRDELFDYALARARRDGRLRPPDAGGRGKVVARARAYV